MIKQPNDWSCLLASAAMALDTDCDTLIAMIGHDGSEIVLPALSEPARRRSFHMQEIIDCAIKLGFSVTPIEVLPYSTPDGKLEFQVNLRNEMRFHSHVYGSEGILTGRAKKLYHAVYWDGEIIHDPNGIVYRLNDCKIDIQCFWKIKSF